MAKVVKLKSDFFSGVSLGAPYLWRAPHIITDYLNGIDISQTAEDFLMSTNSMKVYSTHVKAKLGLCGNRRGLLKLVAERGAEFVIDLDDLNNFSALHEHEWQALKLYAEGYKTEDVARFMQRSIAYANVRLGRLNEQFGYRNIQHCVTSFQAVQIFNERKSGNYDYFPNSSVLSFPNIN